MRNKEEYARRLRNKTNIKPRAWKIILNNNLSLELFTFKFYFTEELLELLERLYKSFTIAKK